MLCPVPPEQRPINEFRELYASWFFHWSTLELKPYLVRLMLLWGGSWLLAGPLAAASFAPEEYPLRFLLVGAGGAGFLLALVLLRLYLGWGYVGDRLLQQTVVYEETGWYDGQSWEKPTAELVQDRLISTYQVQPILRRLRWTLGLLVVLLLLDGTCWNLLD